MPGNLRKVADRLLGVVKEELLAPEVIVEVEQLVRYGQSGAETSHEPLPRLALHRAW